MTLRGLVPERYRRAWRSLAGTSGARPRRFIRDGLGVAGLFEAMNGGGVRYAVLRWFDRLPWVRYGSALAACCCVAHHHDGRRASA